MEEEKMIYAPKVIFDSILKHPPFYIADDNVDMRKKCIDFLKFIYQDVYPIEKQVSLHQTWYNGNARMAVDGSKDSIVAYVADIFNGTSEQLEALNRVFDYAALVHQCYEIGLSKQYNLKPCIINIYAMLRAISKHKGNFNQLVCNLSFMPSRTGNGYFDEIDKLMVDAIIDCEYPYKIDLLKQLINKSNMVPFSYDYTKFTNGLKLLDAVTKDAMKTYNLSSLRAISADVFEYSKVSNNNMAPIYYNAALIYPGRYELFRKKILTNIENEEFRKDILRLVGEVEWDFLGQRGYSFEKCMDAIFDSDTLGELLNKLNVLTAFRHDSLNEKTFKKLDGIFTGQCIDRIGDTEISYSLFADKIEKPQFIEDRTKLLYCKLFDIDENEFANWMFYLKLRNISEAVEELHKNVSNKQDEHAKQLKKAQDLGSMDNSFISYAKWSGLD